MPTSGEKSTSYLMLLKIGAISASLFYFGLTVNYLLSRGSPFFVSVIAALVWALMIVGIAAFKR